MDRSKLRKLPYDGLRNIIKYARDNDIIEYETLVKPKEEIIDIIMDNDLYSKMKQQFDKLCNFNKSVNIDDISNVESGCGTATQTSPKIDYKKIKIVRLPISSGYKVQGNITSLPVLSSVKKTPKLVSTIKIKSPPVQIFKPAYKITTPNNKSKFTKSEIDKYLDFLKDINFSELRKFVSFAKKKGYIDSNISMVQSKDNFINIIKSYNLIEKMSEYLDSLKEYIDSDGNTLHPSVNIEDY